MTNGSGPISSTPSEVGCRAEAAVAYALVRNGARVFVPLFASHSRADLVFEDEQGLHRVQCKSARLSGDVLTFRTCSNTRNSPKEYEGEIDVFGVYSPDLDEVFLVPIEDVPTRLCSLRIDPARNNQAKRVRWAKDYASGGGASRTATDV